MSYGPTNEQRELIEMLRGKPTVGEQLVDIVFHTLYKLHEEHHRVILREPDDLETKAYKAGLYFAERKLLDVYESMKEAE
ncbi:hypothetical protein O0555_15640 [Brevibacillus laterosporus]|uniref:hypothetical protein n=1 Tax=Bacillales TaxID=1385 RepID=UPI000F8E25B1|nr:MULTISPECIES: hypothetical protein [Bacillales]MCR8938766.1 hypothetical protein [Brevibacillus laterosporus]MCZ0841406.1 hypothetical protein [Brevibacillus laterosporus]MCZ0847728.1 hypothetical protein [Brevibacillus laterosporus]RUR59885.1 hypothetical protein ELS81_29430 [Bacillus sp. VKPM B-3276]